MRLKSREKKYLILLAVAAVSIAAYLLLVDPFLESQASLKAEIAKNEATLEKYRTVMSKKEQLLAQREFLRKKLGVLEVLLLKGDKPPLAAAELQKILKEVAESTGVYIDRERILDPVKVDIFLKIPVEIYTTTEISKLSELLYRLENNKKYLMVPELEIAADNVINPRFIKAKLVVAGLIRIK